MRTRDYFVYILSSPSRVLYIGVTNNLVRRLYEHRTGAVPGFAFKHGAGRLVYFEMTSDVRAAIQRGSS